MAMHFFSGLVADPNVNTRALLKAAAKAVTEFGDIVLVSRLEEVKRRLSRAPHDWDLVFISHRIASSEVQEFLKEFNPPKPLADCALIKLTPGGELEVSDVGNLIVQGFTGILCEPFSSEGLRECAKQAAEIKLSSSKKRFVLALRVLISALSQDYKARKTARMQKQREEVFSSCRRIRGLAEYLNSSYEAIVEEAFEEISKDKSPQYTGPSERLREKFAVEEAAIDELKEELLKIK